MGKAVSWDIEWMKRVASVEAINHRPGSEHTVDYLDSNGNAHTVRVPVCFIDFLYKAVAGASKAKRAA